MKCREHYLGVTGREQLPGPGLAGRVNSSREDPVLIFGIFKFLILRSVAIYVG